jgi:hypothetical protein
VARHLSKSKGEFDSLAEVRIQIISVFTLFCNNHLVLLFVSFTHCLAIFYTCAQNIPIKNTMMPSNNTMMPSNISQRVQWKAFKKAGKLETKPKRMPIEV